MATIRIADIPHPRDELPRSAPPDAVSSGIGDRLGRTDTRDDIYNIRSRSVAPSLDQRKSLSRDVGKEDDDPGLRKPSDFKQKQVPTNAMANLYSRSSIMAGVQGQNAYVACLSIDRRHLWRHWDEPSLRLLVDVHLPTIARGSHRRALDNYLELVHYGDGEIRFSHPSC
jgi:hypothetical protein